MDTLFYEAKHAHFACLRLWRPWAAEQGLTPARVDMLRAVQREVGMRVRQSALPGLLNVSKTVVSIMARALERLGFLRRRRSSLDGRTFVLSLTLRAKVALRALFHDAVHHPVAALALATAITLSGTLQPSFEPTKWALEARLRRLREEFGRGRPYVNPWLVEDEDEEFFYANVVGNPNNAELAAMAAVPLDDDSELDDYTFEPLPPPRDEAKDFVYDSDRTS